ncbi:hypothetical protein D3C73_1352510 [compost metagenome]
MKSAILYVQHRFRLPLQQLNPAVKAVHRAGCQLRPEHHPFTPVEIQVAMLLLRLGRNPLVALIHYRI